LDARATFAKALSELDAPAEPPPILSGAEFVASFVPPDFVIDGILQKQFIYSLTAPTNAGKTAIMLLLAAHVALGRDIAPGVEVERSRVLYLAGENPVDVMMRWIAMSQQHDFVIADTDVHFMAGTFPIAEAWDLVAADIEAIGGVGLVFVDTMAAYFRGEDENSNAQMAAYARLLRSLTTLPGGPCVVIACHPPKNAGNDNLQPRGGGAFIAEVDGNLTAKRDADSVELHWQGKFRGPDFSPIAFELKQVTHQNLKDSKGRLRPTIIARHISDVAKEAKATAYNADVRRLLQFISDDPRASLTDLAARMEWPPPSGKARAQRMTDALVRAKLVAKGFQGKHQLTKEGRRALEEGP